MIVSGCGKDVSVREWNGEMKAPLGVEYQWIDMLIYGVLMMTYTLMAMDVDNEGVWRAPSTKQVESHTGWWEPSPCRIRQWYGRWSKQGRVCHAIHCRGDA